MCLMELDPLLKSPVLDVEWEQSAPGTTMPDWAPQDAFSNKIGSRFPESDRVLVSRLGRANYDRYLRCQEERDRQAAVTNNDDPDAILQLAKRDANSEAGRSLFHDSGLGSSLPTSYAETIMSYRTKEDQSVRIPPLPQGAKEGKPFQCIACAKSVVAKNNSAWKQHLYEDLRPWLCLDLSCSLGNAAFNSRNDWISHLALGHGMEPQWKSFQCSLCLVSTGDGKIAITKHLGAHLEEISLAALPSGVNESEDGKSEDTGSEGEGVEKGTDHHQDASGVNDSGVESGTSQWDHSKPRHRTRRPSGDSSVAEGDANSVRGDADRDGDRGDLRDISPARSSGQERNPPHLPAGPLLDDALEYLDKIRETYSERPDVYTSFMEVMKAFKAKQYVQKPIQLGVRGAAPFVLANRSV